MIYCIVILNQLQQLIRLIITKTKAVTRKVAQWDLNIDPLDSDPNVPNHCTTALRHRIQEEMEV